MKRTVFLSMTTLALAAVALAGFFMRWTAEPVSAFSPEKFSPETTLSQDEQSGEYNFDKNHSFIGFRIKHMGLIDVPGYFRNFEGTVNYDAKNIANSSVNFTAKMTSIDTGVQARDNHLRTKDFFEVETYPDMTFKSTKVEKSGNNFVVTGDLTMKGVTKQVSLPFQLTGFVPDRRGVKMGITAETQINRRDFGVNYGGNMPNGTAMLGDQVTVTLQIEAAKRPPAPPAQAE